MKHIKKFESIYNPMKYDDFKEEEKLAKEIKTDIRDILQGFKDDHLNLVTKLTVTPNFHLTIVVEWTGIGRYIDFIEIKPYVHHIISYMDSQGEFYKLQIYKMDERWTKLGDNCPNIVTIVKGQPHSGSLYPRDIMDKIDNNKLCGFILEYKL